MSGFFDAKETPLVRTDCSNDAAWDQLILALSTPSVDGFLPVLSLIEASKFAGATATQVAEAAMGSNHAVLFVADALTMELPDQPILCLNLFEAGQAFRVIPSELWSVENNLSLGNMDFRDFTDGLGEDGIHRGF